MTELHCDFEVTLGSADMVQTDRGCGRRRVIQDFCVGHIMAGYHVDVYQDQVEIDDAATVVEDAYLDEQEREEKSEPLDLAGDRRLVTQPYDYSIQQLVAEVERNKIRLDIEYQRKYVWDDGKASRLIESLLLNVPIPVCYFAEDDDFNFEVIDGLQRITSLKRYLSDGFALAGVTVLNEIQGKRFSELAGRDQRRLESRTMRCVAITSDSHPDIKFDVFERLNTNVAVLNAQEIRNCVYRGDFNSSLKELAGHPQLQELAGNSGRRRMLPEELVLRFFALHDELTNYRPPLRQFINKYMRDRRSRTLSAEERTLFIDCVDTSLQAFGRSAFSVPDRSGTIHNTINKALFDAVMVPISMVDRESIRARQPDLTNFIPDLLSDDEFRGTLGRATADRKRVYSRIRAVSLALEHHGINSAAIHLVGRLDQDER